MDLERELVRILAEEMLIEMIADDRNITPEEAKAFMRVNNIRNQGGYIAYVISRVI